MTRASTAGLLALAILGTWMTTAAQGPGAGSGQVSMTGGTAQVTKAGAAARLSPVSLTVRNRLAIARPGESIVLAAADIAKVLPVDDVRKVHVADGATGQELLAQPIDVNDDGTFDEVLFQADFAPGQERTFTLSAGERQVFTREQFRAYGRFVRERRDDFAWENDRIAHRMYGTALETWAQEPLTSSAVDVWSKRTRRLVINDWYMVDDYHRDHGEGADLYSAGTSRGCGGTALWAGGKLYPSANFRDTRVLANGPLRVMFELVYPAWDVNGQKVSEVKRITLDAGQNIGRYESQYTGAGAGMQHAVGVKKQPGSTAAPDKAKGILRTWEPVKDAGNLGCGVIVDPGLVADFPEAERNYLVVTRLPASGPAVSYSGFGWDRSGDFRSVADWDAYLARYAERVRSPLEISYGPKTGTVAGGGGR
jgi:hypothetical protein